VNRSRDTDLVRNPALIFKIYIANTDKEVPTNIDVDKIKCSDYPGEKEVLIMPNFCFTVLEIDDKDPKCVEIVVAEIPY
jgi:hypothetical protein